MTIGWPIKLPLVAGHSSFQHSQELGIYKKATVKSGIFGGSEQIYKWLPYESTMTDMYFHCAVVFFFLFSFLVIPIATEISVAVYLEWYLWSY